MINIKELEDLLKSLENGEEVLQPNLEAIAKLAEENEKPPKELEQALIDSNPDNINALINAMMV